MWRTNRFWSSSETCYRTRWSCVQCPTKIYGVSSDTLTSARLDTTTEGRGHSPFKWHPLNTATSDLNLGPCQSYYLILVQCAGNFFWHVKSRRLHINVHHPPQFTEYLNRDLSPCFSLNILKLHRRNRLRLISYFYVRRLLLISEVTRHRRPLGTTSRTANVKEDYLKQIHCYYTY